MFMGGLFFLGLFVFGQHDKTILYFSLFCIVSAIGWSAPATMRSMCCSRT